MSMSVIHPMLGMLVALVEDLDRPRHQVHIRNSVTRALAKRGNSSELLISGRAIFAPLTMTRTLKKVAVVGAFQVL